LAATLPHQHGWASAFLIVMHRSVPRASERSARSYSARAYTEPHLHVRLLGRHFFLLNDPEEIDHVLNGRMDRYHRDPIGRRILEPSIGRGILLAEGAEWRRQRRSLASAFQPRYVDRLIPAFHAEATRRMARWDEGSAQSQNLLEDFRALTLAIAARAMFSIEDDDQTAELAKLMNDAERLTSFLDWRDFLSLLLGRGIPQPPVRQEFGERWRAWTVSFLEKRPPLTQLDEARDLLDLLRVARDEASDGAFPMEVIVDQVGTMMAAGFETTAVALFWVALLLALFPEQQEPVRDKLCAQGPETAPEPQFLRSLLTTTASSMRRYGFIPQFTASRVKPTSAIVSATWKFRAARRSLCPLGCCTAISATGITHVTSIRGALSATDELLCPKLGCLSVPGRAFASA
jgi:cytochrome P450